MTKMFYQVSWLNSSNVRVYGDIETDRAKAQMQAPTSANGMFLQMGEYDNITELRRQNKGAGRTFFDPTPRSERR